MSVQPVVQYASRTDVGMRRSANQDSLVVRLCSDYEEWAHVGHLFVVADGMGGHSVGDLASRITVETLPLAFAKSAYENPADRLAAAIDSANRAINDKARENPEFSDMGTTCSTLSLSATGAWVGHVGDSRVYRVRDGIIEQLTFDHSLQWEMIRQGRATADNSEMLHPKNVITRCLGPDTNVEIDVEGPFDVRPGDRFLLCSDGLTGHVTDPELGAIMAGLPPTEATRFLVDLANCRGGSDNSTVVIAVVDDYPPIQTPTIESKTVNMSQTQPMDVPMISQAAIERRTIVSRMTMSTFGLLGFGGLVLLFMRQQFIGLGLICVALFLVTIQLIATTRRKATIQLEKAPEPAGRAESALLGVREPAASTPYRRESAELQPGFLDQLAKAQSELTAAAQDNGWDLDTEELSRLSDKAAESRAAADGGLPHYARAMRILMKEFSARLRPRA